MKVTVPKFPVRPGRFPIQTQFTLSKTPLTFDTMFKRVEKRRRKKEEEELGLDEDMKEVLGIHDTDSEESNSESDSEPERDSDSDVEEGRGLGEEGDESEGEDEESGEEEEEEDPSVTVAQALQDLEVYGGWWDGGRG